MMGCVYGWRNIITGMWYIGKTIGTIFQRHHYTERKAMRGDCPRSYFYNTIRKYGWASFEPHVFHESEDEQELFRWEKALIQLFDSYKNGYNATLGGDGTSGCPNGGRAGKGKLLSEEARKNISKGHKGKHLSAEARANISAAKKGKPIPKLQGRRQSAETCAKRGASLRGKPGRHLGSHHSPETRAKISAAHKGKHMSEEAKAKSRATKERNKAERTQNSSTTQSE